MDKHEFQPWAREPKLCGVGGDYDYVCGLPASASVHHGVENKCEHGMRIEEYCFDCVRKQHNEDVLDGRFDEDERPPASVHQGVESRPEAFQCPAHGPRYETYCTLCRQPPAKTTEQLAGEIAEAVYHGRDFPTGDLRDLLIQFAEEIQRRSIEP